MISAYRQGVRGCAARIVWLYTIVGLLTLIPGAASPGPALLELPEVPSLAGATVDGAERERAIHRINELVQQYYFPKRKISDISGYLNQRLSSGAYDAIGEERAFASALNNDLRTASDDPHLRVAYDPEDAVPSRISEEERSSRHVSGHVAEANFGFAGAEWLPGNVGFLDIRAFVPLKFSSATATAAMTFVANTDALIIDLRQNAGGDPETIAFLTSYLFDKKTRLTDIELRDDKTFESWTQEKVSGLKFGGKKSVFVLTSHRTGSGGEQFAYNLQAVKRAVVVGDSTLGQAHFTLRKRIDDRFSISIPNGEAKSPITQTNWDGVGVLANVKVPQRQAVETAYRLALDELIREETSAVKVQYLKTIRDRIQ